MCYNLNSYYNMFDKCKATVFNMVCSVVVVLKVCQMTVQNMKFKITCDIYNNQFSYTIRVPHVETT